MSNHPENPFWAAVLANPSDDLSRLVFADYLDESGEGDRAYLIRLRGFATVAFGDGGDGGNGVGGGFGVGGGVGGGGGGGGGGVGVGGGGGGGVGVGGGVGGGGVFTKGGFLMSPGLCLVYFPAGYYPLVQVAWVYPDGADLVLIGSRVVANSGIGPEWARLASEGPTSARLHAAAEGEVRLPRTCLVYRLNVERWAAHLPEAVAFSKKKT